MQRLYSVTLLCVSSLTAGTAFAQTTADAKSALKVIVGNAKSKGAAKAAEELTSGADLSKCKESPALSCYIVSADGTMIGNAKNAKLVGTKFPSDMTDVDGTPIVDQVVAPLNKGKTTWEAQYKFAIPGTKKIVPLHAFCEKLDARSAACAVAQIAQD